MKFSFTSDKTFFLVFLKLIYQKFVQIIDPGRVLDGSGKTHVGRKKSPTLVTNFSRKYID